MTSLVSGSLSFLLAKALKLPIDSGMSTSIEIWKMKFGDKLIPSLKLMSISRSLLWTFMVYLPNILSKLTITRDKIAVIPIELNIAPGTDLNFLFFLKVNWIGVANRSNTVKIDPKLVRYFMLCTVEKNGVWLG